ncbi:MAG: response regulator transcription factor [Clostridiaceae bacterium]|nr:response regulator transcription factor [Clostridiaceae bacterium]
MVYNVLIADDDDGMRLLLKKAIEKNKSFKVAGEAADGESAALLAESLRPDVVFLDVEMPGLNGIDCAKRIQDINPKTIIIFVTAHEEYMPDAFHLYAFDYMVKPFHPNRISQTLDRIVFLERQTISPVTKQVEPRNKGLGKIIIRGKEGITFIDEGEIILIQREDKSTVIYTADERHITSESLGSLEEKLDKRVFFRGHRSYIINLTMIYKIFPYGRWTYIIKLRNTDKDALVTHEKYEELQKLFK